MKKLLHDWLGIVATAMVAAALIYFVSPWAESVLGPDRTRTLQVLVFFAFAFYGVVYFLRFTGLLGRRKD